MLDSSIDFCSLLWANLRLNLFHLFTSLSHSSHVQVHGIQKPVPFLVWRFDNYLFFLFLLHLPKIVFEIILLLLNWRTPINHWNRKFFHLILLIILVGIILGISVKINCSIALLILRFWLSIFAHHKRHLIKIFLRRLPLNCQSLCLFQIFHAKSFDCACIIRILQGKFWLVSILLLDCWRIVVLRRLYSIFSHHAPLMQFKVWSLNYRFRSLVLFLLLHSCLSHFEFVRFTHILVRDLLLFNH